MFGHIAQMKFKSLIPTSFALVLISAANVCAHGMGPMILKDTVGSLVISNRSDKSIRVRLKAYPVNEIAGKEGPSSVPYSKKMQNKLLKLSKDLFRVRSMGFKSVKYRILPTTNSFPFYICSFSIQGSFSTRVCSLWEG